MPKYNPIQNIKTLVSRQHTFKFLLFLYIFFAILTSFTLTTVHLNNLEEESRDNVNKVIEESEVEENEIPSEINTEEESVVVETPSTETTPSNTIKKPTKTNTPVTIIEEPEVPEPIVVPPPPPEQPSAVVAFYSDNQSDTDQEDLNHQRVVNYILNSGANPVFSAGDIMEDGTQSSLDRFNTVTATLRSSRIFYSALGNNDRKEGDSSTVSQIFLDNFVFPNNEHWYSVNYGNLHLVVLDSAFSSGSSTQLNWLTNDLQSSNSQNRITGVLFHHPTFASTISQQLISYGVDFVISGHNHAYAHTISNGIHYFVLTGQPSIGYMTAKVYSDKISLTSYNSGNGVIERVEFNER